MTTPLDTQVLNLVNTVTSKATELVNEVALLNSAVSSVANNRAAAATQVASANALSTVASMNSTEIAAVSGLAATAYSGATPLNETLAAVNKTFFTSSGIVASIIYDTKKDSDGGQWRKRCSHTSWYKETIYGRYLGEVATEAAARALTNATTRDYFHNTTDGLFYALLAGSGVVQVYRGNKREFPEVVAITAEAGRVIIWDLTDPSVPMWMVVPKTAWNPAPGWFQTDATVSPIAINGKIFWGTYLVASPPHLSGGVCFLSLISDKFGRYGQAAAPGWSGTSSGISRRVSSAVNLDEPNTLPGIVSPAINSIAATVLPNAPIDPATGLPVPTIAVGTAGGVSVIKDDGTVYNPTSPGNTFKVGFLKNNTLIYGALNTIQYQLSASGITANTAPTLIFGNGAAGTTTYPIQSSSQLQSICSSSGLIVTASPAFSLGMSVIKHNETTPLSGVSTAITNTYNSGWMNGDIRLAALADSDRMAGGVESISGAELVTNGTFNTDTSSWPLTTYAGYNNGVVSWNASGYLQLNPSGTGYTAAESSFSTVAGKAYRLSITMPIANTCTSSGVIMGVGQGSGSYFNNNTGNAAGTKVFTFVATSSVANILVYCYGASGTFHYVDNISVIECAADRSVKANPLTVVGTLNKSPVNTGSQLVTYYGFSASNYLTQPYSANLDFGTGDFCVMGWYSPYNSVNAGALFHRTLAGSTGGILILNTAATGIQQVYLSNSLTYTLALSSSVGISATPAMSFVCVTRKSGVLSIYINGMPAGSAANTTDVTYVNAVTVVGNRCTLNDNIANATLVRVSATAPSADQIAYIYETERKLFEPGAQCTIQGNSSSVTTLTYDNETDLLDVGTSWGRTTFKGLTVQSSEAATNGAALSYNRNGSTLIQTGATGAKISVPSKTLRSELNRAGELKKEMNSDLIQVDFDAVTSQTTFVLPYGFSAQVVYSAGSEKRLGASKDYTVTNDGFRDSVVFNVAPGNTVWVSVMCLRNLA